MKRSISSSDARPSSSAVCISESIRNTNGFVAHLPKSPLASLRNVEITARSARVLKNGATFRCASSFDRSTASRKSIASTLCAIRSSFRSSCR